MAVLEIAALQLVCVPCTLYVEADAAAVVSGFDYAL
jgi:hypothetical protein